MDEVKFVLNFFKFVDGHVKMVVARSPGVNDDLVRWRAHKY